MTGGLAGAAYRAMLQITRDSVKQCERINKANVTRFSSFALISWMESLEKRVRAEFRRSIKKEASIQVSLHNTLRINFNNTIVSRPIFACQ
jgi:hypothetical protein